MPFQKIDSRIGTTPTILDLANSGAATKARLSDSKTLVGINKEGFHPLLMGMLLREMLLQDKLYFAR